MPCPPRHGSLHCGGVSRLWGAIAWALLLFWALLLLALVLAPPACSALALDPYSALSPFALDPLRTKPPWLGLGLGLGLG